MADEPTISMTTLAGRVDGLDAAQNLRRDTRSITIRGITLDSREVTSGDLFVALRGASVDGHNFIDDAIANGASAVLLESGRVDPGNISVPVLRASDTRRMLGEVAAEFFGYPSRKMTVVGITGTNGKTTTSHMLAEILRDDLRVGRIGTVGARWGETEVELPNTTPESLELQQLMWRMVDDGVETVVLEVSSHGLVTHRMRGTSVDVGLFTNLSQDHLDFHGDIESYREAKARLFDAFVTGDRTRHGRPVGLFNVGDDTGERFARRFSSTEMRVARYRVLDGDQRKERSDASGEELDYAVDDVRRTIDGSSFRFRSREFEADWTTPMLGAFNIENAAAAAAAALELGVAPDVIKEGLRDGGRVRGRMERIEPPDKSDSAYPSVLVDYAHTPDALRRALETLAPLTDGALIVVFGCGGDRDVGKRPEMGRVAHDLADRAVVTSDNPRSEKPEAIIEDILEGVPDGRRSQRIDVVPDRGAAIEKAIRDAGPGDTVLIAGKGHETYQEIAGERRPFDDAERATAALRRREVGR